MQQNNCNLAQNMQIKPVLLLAKYGPKRTSGSKHSRTDSFVKNMQSSALQISALLGSRLAW